MLPWFLVEKIINILGNPKLCFLALEAPPKPAGNVKFENMSSNNFTIGLTTSGKGNNGITHYIVERCESGKNDWKEVIKFVKRN